MSYLDRTQIVELARKTREIDERPSAVLESFYLRAFERHAAKFPNDLNFIVEFAQPGKSSSVGGNGFGVATCLEDYCWIDIRLGADPAEKDGGRSHGFGSLWEYQNHCDTADHIKGRKERCSKSKTYLPTDGRDGSDAVAPAAAPAAPVPGPSRPTPASVSRTVPPVSQYQFPNSHASSSKSTLPPRAMPSSSPLVNARAGSSSSNVLLPSSKQNMPSSSPSSRLETKPSVPGYKTQPKVKSVLSILDSLDDEVSVVHPDDVPVEFRKVINEANPYTLDDDDDVPPARGSSAAAPAPAPVVQPVIHQAKPEPGYRGPAAPVGQAPAIYVNPQNLAALQAQLAQMKLDRDAQIRTAYRTLLTPAPGEFRTPAITRVFNDYAQALGVVLYSDSDHFPVLPQEISITSPSFVQIEALTRVKHVQYRQSAVELASQINAARTAGILGPVGSVATATAAAPGPGLGPGAIAPPPAAAVAAALAAAVAPGAAAALPNPHGYTGEELDDYHDMMYPDRGPPIGDLQTFFQGAMQDFSEDQDIGKAMKTLGLDNQEQKLGDMTVTLMPHQILGVAFMLEKEKDKRYMGGLLCDAMGLGKTIATLCGNQSEDGRVKTTLIVAPLAVLNQWKMEIESKTAEGTFKILVHHGATRAKTSKEFRQADVVLTTYGTMVSDFAEPKQKKKKRRVPGLLPSDDEDDNAAAPVKRKGPCFKMRWFRVVLDEAHFIRNKATQASKAAAELDAVHRWSLTGTLINNTLDDVYPHLRFLGISPQSEWAEFNKHISKRVKKNPKRAADRTQAILKTCMMRRHKDSVLNGHRLLNLPPKNTTEVELDFSMEERAIYDQVENRMKIKFGKFLKQGTVLKNMSCVLTMLMRLRQLTCHPWLLRRNPGDPAHPDDFIVSDEDLNLSMNIPIINPGADLAKAVQLLGDVWVADVTARLKARHEATVEAIELEGEDQDDECPVCFEPFDYETVTECKHSYCRDCLEAILTAVPRDGGDLTDEQTARGARKCPLCRALIEKNKLFAAVAFFDPEKEQADEDATLGEGSGSGSGSDRKGKRKSMGDESDDDLESNDSRSAKRLDKGKGKAKAADDEEPMELDEIASVLPSTKMKVMGDLIDEYLAEDGIKVLIFSEFVTYLKLVERFLDNKGVPNRMYYGGMRTSDREDVIKEFTGPIKNDRSPRVMLISRKAGGAGLNLTAASKVISLDLAWNAAAENQAVDRAHRIGQTRPVDVRRLIIKDTVEQRILALQEKKSALADGAMGEGTGGKLGRLTVQDLMRLFNYDD